MVKSCRLASTLYNLHSFKQGVILVCQSILETRRMSYLHGSALFTIPISRITDYKKFRKIIKPLFFNKRKSSEESQLNR